MFRQMSRVRLGGHQVWEDGGLMHAASASFWRAVPPAGYVALGDVVARGHHKPALDLVWCVPATNPHPCTNGALAPLCCISKVGAALARIIPTMQSERESC